MKDRWNKLARKETGVHFTQLNYSLLNSKEVNALLSAGHTTSLHLRYLTRVRKF